MTTEGLPSARGLVERGRGPNTPLRDVRGILQAITRTEMKNVQGHIVQFNLSDIEVIHAVEVYHLPIAVIEVKESALLNSAWGILSRTLTDIIPEEEDWEHQLGKNIRYTWKEGVEENGSIRKYHDLGFKDKNWEIPVDEAGQPLATEKDRPNVIADAWEVTEIDGVGSGESVSAEGKAKEYLDGQNLANFNKAAMADPIIKRDEAFRATILNGEFIKGMLESGEFVKGDDQVYRRADVPETTEEPF